MPSRPMSRIFCCNRNEIEAYLELLHGTQHGFVALFMARVFEPCLALLHDERQVINREWPVAIVSMQVILPHLVLGIPEPFDRYLKLSDAPNHEEEVRRDLCKLLLRQ